MGVTAKAGERERSIHACPEAVLVLHFPTFAPVSHWFCIAACCRGTADEYRWPFGLSLVSRRHSMLRQVNAMHRFGKWENDFDRGLESVF